MRSAFFKRTLPCSIASKRPPVPSCLCLFHLDSAGFCPSLRWRSLRRAPFRSHATRERSPEPATSLGKKKQNKNKKRRGKSSCGPPFFRLGFSQKSHWVVILLKHYALFVCVYLLYSYFTYCCVFVFYVFLLFMLFHIFSLVKKKASTQPNSNHKP